MKQYDDSTICQRRASFCTVCGKPVIHFSEGDALASNGGPACPQCYGRFSTPDKAKKINGAFCKFCGTKTELCPEYDAVFCRTCDIWLEKQCGSPTCVFCAGRPARPSQTRESADEQDIRPLRPEKRPAPSSRMAEAYKRRTRGASGDSGRGGAGPDEPGR